MIEIVHKRVVDDDAVGFVSETSVARADDPVAAPDEQERNGLDHVLVREEVF